jgi:hypothetical protein
VARCALSAKTVSVPVRATPDGSPVTGLLRAEADVHRQRAPADMRQRGMIAVMAVA